MNEFREIQAAKIRAMYGIDNIVKSEEVDLTKSEKEEKYTRGPSFEDLENLNSLDKGDGDDGEQGGGE